MPRRLTDRQAQVLAFVNDHPGLLGRGLTLALAAHLGVRDSSAQAHLDRLRLKGLLGAEGDGQAHADPQLLRDVDEFLRGLSPCRAEEIQGRHRLRLRIGRVLGEK